MMENQIEIKVSPQKQKEIPFMAQAFATESIGALKDAQEHEPQLVESTVGLEKLNIQGCQFQNSIWHPS